MIDNEFKIRSTIFLPLEINRAIIQLHQAKIDDVVLDVAEDGEVEQVDS